MFDIRYNPLALATVTMVVDVRNSQLHQDYTIDSDKTMTAVLSESQLVADLKSRYLFCILRKSMMNSLEIALPLVSFFKFSE
jgi:hypothetical protein